MTPKQEKFCVEFVKTCNASEAYRMAYDAKGCSDSTVHNEAHRLRDNPEIIARIDELVERAARKAEFKAEEAILSMARAVRFDPRKLYAPVTDEFGEPVKDAKGRQVMRQLEVWELDEDTALALQSVEIEEITAGESVIGITRKVKACDRNVAREQAHKYFGHYKEDNTQKGDAAITALMAAVAGNASNKPAIKN